MATADVIGVSDVFQLGLHIHNTLIILHLSDILTSFLT